MKKYSVPFIAFSLFAWIIGGSWWYANFYQTQSADNQEIKTLDPDPFELTDGSFRAFSDQPFYFIKNQSRVHIPAQTNEALYTLIGFINNSEDRIISLTGYYTIDESYEGEFENLGFDRAASLENRLIRLGIKEGKVKVKAEQKELSFETDNKCFNATKISIEKIGNNTKPISKKIL